MAVEGQNPEHWKEKYYDQLDRLEAREQHWSQLEAILKKAISRISLAAEGQHQALDQYIDSLRQEIRHDIDIPKLESTIDSISQLLGKLEEKQSQGHRQVIFTLEQLLSQLKLPGHCEKLHKKLSRKLKKLNDDHSEQGLQETLDLLNNALQPQLQEHSKGPTKAGLINRLFHSEDNHQAAASPQDHSINEADIKAFSSLLLHILRLIPWPETIRSTSSTTLNAIALVENFTDLQLHIKQLEQLIKDWPEHSDLAPQVVQIEVENPNGDNSQGYQQCLLDFITWFEPADDVKGQLSALKLSTKQAHTQSELNQLALNLSRFLQISPAADSDNSDDSVAPAMLPSLGELLIRLLEQLTIPESLQSQAEQIRQQLENDPQHYYWKRHLKQVVELVNAIRSQLQSEKQEFEDFLQQVTDRLKVMDQFLVQEGASLQLAQDQGDAFDQKFQQDVGEIRDDVNQASDIQDLKTLVQTKLDTISSHIKLYRDSEQQRVDQSQQQLKSMQQRMQNLEQQTQQLKKAVIAKNKQAMFDVLTAIPNRLAYEKRVQEEIARMQRFNTPLSLVVWDIDFFKKVNDSYGHKAGDKVLKTVAQLLNKRIRETDFLARYGGEEFVMLLPDTNEEQTLGLVDSLRRQVESCGFHYHGDAVTITVSCGISGFRPDDLLGQVFERADQALYQAKQQGRNQCIIAPQAQAEST